MCVRRTRMHAGPCAAESLFPKAQTHLTDPRAVVGSALCISSSCPPSRMPAQRSRAWRTSTELPSDAVMTKVCEHADDVKLTRRCAMRREGESRRGLDRRARANLPTAATLPLHLARACSCRTLLAWVVTTPLYSIPACAQRRILASRLLVVCGSAARDGAVDLDRAGSAMAEGTHRRLVGVRRQRRRRAPVSTAG